MFGTVFATKKLPAQIVGVFKDGREVPIIHRMIRMDASFVFSNSFGLGFGSSAVPTQKKNIFKKYHNTEKYKIHVYIYI